MFRLRSRPSAPRRLGSLGIVLICVMSGGCGRGGSGPATVPVRGRVTFEGAPLTQGTVMFRAASSSGDTFARPATGIIGGDGTYQMSTFAPEDGVIPGEYEVLVVSYTGGPTPEEPNAPEVWAIPQRYGNPVESGLSASVPASQREALVLDFDLE